MRTFSARSRGRSADTCPLLPQFTKTVYGVTGGASDGFVLDDETHPAFYMALNGADGDVEGVKLNMTHELYHVVQRAARARVPGLNAKVFDPDTAPAHVRLLTVIVEEGTATYVAEPLLGLDELEAGGGGSFHWVRPGSVLCRIRDGESDRSPPWTGAHGNASAAPSGAFFRAYIDRCRENPAAVPARFSKATEAYLDSIPPI